MVVGEIQLWTSKCNNLARERAFVCVCTLYSAVEWKCTIATPIVDNIMEKTAVKKHYDFQQKKLNQWNKEEKYRRNRGKP